MCPLSIPLLEQVEEPTDFRAGCISETAQSEDPKEHLLAHQRGAPSSMEVQNPGHVGTLLLCEDLVPAHASTLPPHHDRSRMEDTGD